MRRPPVKIIVFFLLISFLNGNLLPQSLRDPKQISGLRFNRPDNHNKTQSSPEFYAYIGSLVILIATPTIVYENKKLYFGLAREISLMLGRIGEFRISGEYNYIFRSRLNHIFRAAVKYDILSSLSRGEWIDMRDFFSFGTGYFVDADGGGISPEISAGFRIGADESICFYPCIKLRHTFMFKKDKPDNTDLSVGMAFGFKPY